MFLRINDNKANKFYSFIKFDEIRIIELGDLYKEHSPKCGETYMVSIYLKEIKLKTYGEEKLLSFYVDGDELREVHNQIIDHNNKLLKNH